MGPWAVMVALVLAGAPATPASAPPIERTTIAAPTEVDAIVIVGLAPALGVDEADLDAVLSSHLAGTGLALEVVPLPTDTATTPDAWARAQQANGLRAVFWLVPEGADAVRLELWLPGDAGTWGRSLPAGDDGDALLESIGVMVRSMATSIETTPPPPVVPPPIATTPSPKPTPPPAATPPRERVRVDVALGYAGSNVARALPWHSGVGLRVHTILPRGATPMLGVVWAPGVSGPDDPPTNLTRVSVDLGVAATLRRARRVQPIVGGAVVAEALGWRVREVARGQGWAARVGLAAIAGLDVALSRRLGLLVLARADAWLANTTLVLDTPQGERRLLRAHPVAGTVWAGLRVRLAGLAPSRNLHPSVVAGRHTRR